MGCSLTHYSPPLPVKVIQQGHLYELENFEHPDREGQVIQFIEKVPQAEGSAILTTLHDGTTNEELLRVLVNRLNYLNTKFPCRENSIATTHIETALLWLNKRTDDRKARNVEGKHLA